MPHSQLPSTAISGTGDLLYRVSIPASLTVQDFYVQVYVITTNDGSNYWTIQIQENDGTVVGYVDTSGMSPNTTTLLSDTSIGYSIDTGDVGLVIKVSSKMGNPGNLYLIGPVLRVEWS